MSVLTEQQRDSLPDSAFAVLRPREHTEKRRRAYPVPTVKELQKVGASSPKEEARKLGRSALQRVAQHGNPHEKRLVCMAVARRDPAIHIKHCGVSLSEHPPSRLRA